MKNSLYETFKYEQENEAFCVRCTEKMKLTTRHGHKTYVCTCGHTHRKRTNSEILRDIGYKNN